MSEQAILVGRYAVRVDSKGRIVVPSEIRHALGRYFFETNYYSMINTKPKEIRIYSQSGFQKLLESNPNKAEKLCEDACPITIETKPPHRMNIARPLEAILGSSVCKRRDALVCGRGDYFAVVLDEDKK